MGAREVIVTLGDRRNSGFCLMCGTDLIVPWNDYQCCYKCTKIIQGNIRAMLQKKKMGVKTGTSVLDKSQVARQVTSLGVPVK